MIVPQTFKKVLLTKEGILKTENSTVYGRNIPLQEIRMCTLKKKQESLGLLWIHNDDYYTALTDAEGRSRLPHLGEDANTGKESELESKERLKVMERKRYLIVWNDSSTMVTFYWQLIQYMMRPYITQMKKWKQAAKETLMYSL